MTDLDISDILKLSLANAERLARLESTMNAHDMVHKDLSRRLEIIEETVKEIRDFQIELRGQLGVWKLSVPIVTGVVSALIVSLLLKLLI